MAAVATALCAGPGARSSAASASAAAAASIAADRELVDLAGEPLDGPSPGYPARPEGPTGFFVRATGGWFELQDDARRRDGSGSLDTDDGLGGSLAVGYRDLTRPIVFEIEYAFRDVETEDYLDPVSNLLADNQLDIHSLSANLMFDAPNLFGPVGLYAGAGLGVRISEARIRLGGEDGSVTRLQGEDLLVQAMAGITVSLDPEWQLHAGVRWSDGGTIDEGAVRYDTEAFAIEVGFRLYF